MSNDDATEYALVLPFLPVASKGGPYDDNAYVAGFQMGGLDATLLGAAALGRKLDASWPIHEANADQADLIAMRHGFATERLGEPLDGWVTMRFYGTKS